jgi:hypothetical protein
VRHGVPHGDTMSLMGRVHGRVEEQWLDQLGLDAVFTDGV